MNYNAGYDVKYDGYNYNTGCIDFSEEQWGETYNKRLNSEKTLFAYLKDNVLDEFIGYCNYGFNKDTNRYECGILIEYKHRGKGYSKEALKLLIDHAKNNGIKELYNSFEKDRITAINAFKSVGFKIIEKTTWKKFNNYVEGLVIKKEIL